MSLTTADVARAGRTTARGIHIWDREGLLGPVERNSSGDRVFTDAHAKRARIVGAARMAGMSLAEIKAASDAAMAFNISAAVTFMRGVVEKIDLEYDL